MVMRGSAVGILPSGHAASTTAARDIDASCALAVVAQIAPSKAMPRMARVRRNRMEMIFMVPISVPVTVVFVTPRVA
jgi:hypothetical protein